MASYRRRRYVRRKPYDRVSRGMPSMSAATQRALTKFSPLPTRFINKMKYVDIVAWSAASADVPQVHVFNASSIYDPNYTATGHQPMGYDELSPLYNHWVVLGSKITVKFSQPNGPGINALAKCGIHGSSVVTPLTDCTTMQEQGQSKWVTLGRESNQEGVVTLYYDPHKHMGYKDPMDSDNLQGAIATNPIDNWFFHIWTCNAYPGVAQQQVLATVQIEYTVAWKHPQQLNQS